MINVFAQVSLENSYNAQDLKVMHDEARAHVEQLPHEQAEAHEALLAILVALMLVANETGISVRHGLLLELLSGRTHPDMLEDIFLAV